MNTDRFKFRVWSTKHNCYQAYCSFDLTMEGRLIDGSGNTENHGREDLIVEQCTGLRDINGNLIYIGDIVAIKIKGLPDDIRTVEYEEDGIDGIYPFNLYHDCGDDCNCKLRDFPEYACEIIGNIHEQKEQK